MIARRGLVPALVTLLAAFAVAGCGGGSSSSSTTHAKGAHRPRSSAQVQHQAAVAALIPPPGAPPRAVDVPVLTYHRVAPLSAVGQTDLKVDPANFAAELAALHAGGYHPIHQAQLFDALYHGARLPSKPIIISVDDGYVDDVRTILPDLQRWHMVATFFVITGRMTEPGFLTADQIRELDQAGMDVGDHTVHHLDLPMLTSAEQRSEIAGSRAVLDQVLGHPVYYFAYPFGAFDEAVIRQVHAAGFTMAFTTAGGTHESSSAPLTIPRVHVGRSETPSGLVSLLGGA
jgi:peptidoglycan/xylan/chitin deacetylase (PgdA/CDA1 family)